MSASVNILCPNGRRFNIKVSPNDTILQMIQQLLNPPDYASGETSEGDITANLELVESDCVPAFSETVEVTTQPLVPVEPSILSKRKRRRRSSSRRTFKPVSTQTEPSLTSVSCQTELTCYDAEVQEPDVYTEPPYDHSYFKQAEESTEEKVLEKVCEKGRFNSDEYTLRHQRNVLDVTVPFRYANVPNLAKLEMVKLTKPRAESVVHIALQVESGQRLSHDFKPDLSLFEILSQWDSKDENSHLASVQVRDGVTYHPVCIYMRREIVGEPWLKHTSLKSLGLTGGKAVIRHMHRATELPPPPSVPVAKPKQTLPSEPSKVASPMTAQEPNLLQSSSDEVRDKVRTAKQTLPVTDNVDSSPIEPMDTTEGKEIGNDESKEDKMRDDDQPMDTDVDNTREGLNQAESVSVEFPSASSGDELRPQEQGSLHDGMKSSQRDTEQQRNQAKYVESFLQSHGSAGVSLDERTRLKIEKLMKKEEEMMKQMNEVAQQLKAQQVESLSNQAATSSAQQLANFKFPDVPQKARNEKKVSSVEGEDLSKPIDRRVLVFHSDDVVPTAEEFQDLPDSFFTVTVDDMRKMLEDLKNQQSSERQLETKAMRDAKIKKEMSKYSKITIRIHFPDHLIMQAFFRPGEKVGALYSFVEECMNEKQSFYLYTTPPKTVLKDKNVTLYQAKLFPAALVYFGSEHSQDQYLSQSILQKKVSLKQAEASAFSERPSGTSSSTSLLRSTSSGGAMSYDVPGPSQTKSKPTSGTSQTSDQSASKGQVPKWFKLGKK